MHSLNVQSTTEKKNPLTQKKSSPGNAQEEIRKAEEHQKRNTKIYTCLGITTLIVFIIMVCLFWDFEDGGHSHDNNNPPTPPKPDPKPDPRPAHAKMEPLIFNSTANFNWSGLSAIEKGIEDGLESIESLGATLAEGMGFGGDGYDGTEDAESNNSPIESDSSNLPSSSTHNSHDTIASNDLAADLATAVAESLSVYVESNSGEFNSGEAQPQVSTFMRREKSTLGENGDENGNDNASITANAAPAGSHPADESVVFE
jgi:hypothetical protein